MTVIATYVLLSLVIIVDVLRQPTATLSETGKAVWILALLVVPVLGWVVYGIWRMRQSRGFPGLWRV